jgi:hypothetical protein
VMCLLALVGALLMLLCTKEPGQPRAEVTDQPGEPTVQANVR